MSKKTVTSAVRSPSTLNYILCLIVGMLFSAQLSSQTLKVCITNIRNTKGQLYVALFKCDSTYSAEVPIWKKLYDKSDIKDKTYCFDIPVQPGVYGLTVLDDENSDAKMNYNIIRLPKEGFGFSNYKHSGLRKPKFKQFSFDVQTHQKVAVKVEMFYF